MSEFDPTFAPLDRYHDQLQDIQPRLEAVSRQNETPIDALGQPLKRGELAERIGRVLMAVPGFPCDILTVMDNTYPAELRFLRNADISDADRTKRFKDYRIRTYGQLTRIPVAVFLDTQGFKLQRGIDRDDGRRYSYN